MSRQQISPASTGADKELKQIKQIFLFSKEETQTNIDILKVFRLTSPQKNTNQNHNDMLKNQDFDTEYTKDASDGPISPDIRKLRQEDPKFKATEPSLKARLGCRVSSRPAWAIANFCNKIKEGAGIESGGSNVFPGICEALGSIPNTEKQNKTISKERKSQVCKRQQNVSKCQQGRREKETLCTACSH